MYATYADMFMILLLVILTTVLHLEQHSRICQRIGYVHSAAWARIPSHLRSNSGRRHQNAIGRCRRVRFDEKDRRICEDALVLF